MADARLQIRRFRASDREAVWHLHNVALTTVGAHAGNGAWDDDLHAIETVYLADGGEFLVGTLGGKLVAMGALRRDSADTAELKRMRVLPPYQRRGFGRAILEALEARAVALGYRQLWLDTTTEQTAALGLYAQAGYVETERRHDGQFEIVTMRRALDAAAASEL